MNGYVFESIKNLNKDLNIFESHNIAKQTFCGAISGTLYLFVKFFYNYVYNINNDDSIIKSKKYYEIKKNKNIVNLNKNIVNNDALDFNKINDIFIEHCKIGNLDGIKKIWEKTNGCVDIHAKNDAPFSWACCYGKLNVAQWLWEISDHEINIRAYNDYSFIWSCNNKHEETVKWLCQLCRDYSYKIDNNGSIIYIIKNIYKEIEENHNNIKKIKNIFNLKQKMDKNFKEKCGICMGYEKNVVSTKCRNKNNNIEHDHYYCVKCFGEWFYKKEKACIYCKRAINIDNCVFLYTKK